MKLTFALLTVVAGIAVSLQSVVNAGLSQRIGLGAALLVNTVVVLAGSLALFLARGPHADFHPPGTPWVLYVGGFCGFFIVACLALVYPRIGAVWATALVILGQSAAALAIDHYGLLGMPRDPMTLSRAAGLALVASGFLLLRR
jgi:transporter family-2 protein